MFLHCFYRIRNWKWKAEIRVLFWDWSHTAGSEMSFSQSRYSQIRINRTLWGTERTSSSMRKPSRFTWKIFIKLDGKKFEIALKSFSFLCKVSILGYFCSRSPNQYETLYLQYILVNEWMAILLLSALHEMMVSLRLRLLDYRYWSLYWFIIFWIFIDLFPNMCWHVEIRAFFSILSL